MCASYTRIQLENYLKTIVIPPKSKVLDVGGSQLPINNRIKQENIISSEFRILDLEKPHECRKKPDYIGDVQKVSKELQENCIKHNIAFCIEVSEYWYNPYQALKNIACFLKKGGTLYISFHLFYPIHNPVEQDYLRYTENGAKKLLEKTGFKVMRFIPRLEKKDFYSFYNVAVSLNGMRPAKDYNNHNLVGCIIEAKKL